MQIIPTLSDADIIPESYQMRLMAWRDEFTRGYFEIGDMANEIVVLNIQTKMQIEQAQIYSAVGRFCGKSGRTIRDYAEIAAFFPVAVREQYDMLPFSHFRFAKSKGTMWEDVLEYSMLHPDAPESKLAFEFDVAASPHPQIFMNADLSPESVAASFPVASQPLPSVAPSVAADLSGIYVLANLISQAESMMSWEMNSETRLKLKNSLDGLKDVLRDLSSKEPSLKFDYTDYRSE